MLVQNRIATTIIYERYIIVYCYLTYYDFGQRDSNLRVEKFQFNNNNNKMNLSI